MDNEEMIDGLVADIIADRALAVIKRAPVMDRADRAQLIIDKLTHLMERARRTL